MDLGNRGHLKIALLCDGLRITPRARDGVGRVWQEKLYSYSLSDWTSEKLLLPSDLKLGDDVYVGFRFNPSSRWSLDRYDVGLAVDDGRGCLTQAQLISRPSYYDVQTPDGVALQSIGVSCGNHGVSFFINSYCEYFRDNLNCRFCGLVPTQKRFCDTLKLKSPEQVAFTLRRILELRCPLDFVQLSGGSLLDHDKEVSNYLPFVRAVSAELASFGRIRDIPIHLTCMPPRDWHLLEELQRMGLDTISFDLECATERAFAKYCPGKHASYGFRNMLQMLKTSLEVFGQGNVYSILILGLEPHLEFIEGVTSLVQEGITPTLNVYHHDPYCSKDLDLHAPDPEDLIRSASVLARLFAKHHMKAGRLGCAHYDIGHEIRKGYFNGSG